MVTRLNERGRHMTGEPSEVTADTSTPVPASTRLEELAAVLAALTAAPVPEGVKLTVPTTLEELDAVVAALKVAAERVAALRHLRDEGLRRLAPEYKVAQLTPHSGLRQQHVSRIVKPVGESAVQRRRAHRQAPGGSDG